MESDRLILVETIRLLKALAEETAEYARINNLGDAWQNHIMKQIREHFKKLGMEI